MLPDNPADKLSSLTGRQREVLRLFCDGWKYADIAKELFIAENTVKTHMGNIYVKLGLEYLDDGPRKKALYEVYCRALKEEVIEPSGVIIEPDEQEPEPVAEHVMALVVRDENALVPVPSGKVISIRPVPSTKPPRQPRRGRWLLLGMILGSAVTACAVYTSVQALDRLTLWIGSFLPTPISSPASMVSEEPTVIVSSPTVEQINPVTSPTSSEGVLVITPTPGQPTQTPIIETSAGLTFLFEDNFDAGLSDYWEVVSGSPVVVNGQLTANEETWMAIGDDTWTDYIVEFDADAATCWFSWSYNTLAVRVVDMNNMIAWRWADCESYWYVIKDGKDNEVPKSGAGTGYGMLRFRIFTEGNQFSVYLGDKLVSSFFDRNYPNGKIALRLVKDTLIDNFVVKQIDK